MEADTHVESVPPLSNLAADAIARFPAVVKEPYRLHTGSKKINSYRLRGDISALPLPVAECLLNAFRRDGDRYGIPLLPNLVEFFMDSTRTPLYNLDLYGSVISDHTLACLLTTHRNLLYLNLGECTELTERLNGLAKRTPLLRRLRILDLGNSVKIFAPWLTNGRTCKDDEESSNDDEDNTAWKAFQELVKSDPTFMESSQDADITDVDGHGHENGDNFGEDTTDSAPVAERMDIAGEMDVGTSGQFSDDEEMRSPPSSPSGSSCSDHTDRFVTDSDRTSTKPPTGIQPKFIFTWSCPNLQALILHGDQMEELFPESTENIVAEFFLCLLQRTKRLLYLDLSYWSKVGDMRFLRPQRHVQTLILYDVPDLYRAIHVISSLISLRHLDLSQSNRDTGQYPRPVTTLSTLVTSLPHLLSLDITSTNLASNPTRGDFYNSKHARVESDIVGLRSLRKPLDYLGIFYCDIAAHYHRIPAKKVAGDANETQILLAAEQYMKRPALELKVLNEAYQIYRFGTPGRYSAALKLMLDAMDNHVEDASIQIAASASVFYIMRNVNMTPATKKRVVNALLTGMEEHPTEQTMARNCCLSLCQFDVPSDLLSYYTRAARLLLRVIDEFQDQMTQRIVIYLLNSMACHVEGDQKVAVGELNAVERILAVIKRRHDANVCDEVMEVSWSFLWNITDETPSNCDRFLRNRGMELFYECYKKFPDKNELLRNMMGLMGNIAEVKEMRSHLMQAEYVTVFCELLKNLSDGIEISYNSAGVLSHMLSDGPSVWKAVDPSIKEATDAVIAAIGTWQIDARRFINYRSFEPILRLLPLFDRPASQHWSIWALANLTTVDGNKYCSYVMHEGGVPLLEEVAVDDRPSGKVRELVSLVMKNVKQWADEKGVDLKEAKRPAWSNSSVTGAN